MLKKSIALIVMVIFLSSCATPPMGGAQIPGDPCQANAPTGASGFLQNPIAASIMNFGGNLLATAATNYSQKYAGKLEKFLTKLVTPKKKRKRDQDQFSQDQFPTDDQQGFQDDSGFDQGVDPNEGFDDQQGQFEGAEEGFQEGEFEGDQGFDPQFADQPVSRGVPGRFSIGQAQGDPCTQNQVGPDGQPYGGDSTGYDPNQSGQGYDPNQSGQGYDPNQSGQDYDPNQSGQGYDPNQSGQGYDQQGYNPESGYDPNQAMGPAIGLDVALVRKTIRNGTPVILPIKDGEILRDGRGNPQAGDKFRIMFRPNSEAYVYIIAVDGSGWAQGIFPTPTSPFANPVKPGEQYVTPEESNWFSLDQFRGVETIFFVASHEPRKDIEDLFKGIMGRERPASATPRQVSQAAIVPNGYGGAQPSQTPFGLTLTSGGQQEILPTSFFAKTAGEDLRITRWFRHQ